MRVPEGLTLRQLKEFIKNMSDYNAEGEECEVWILNSNGTSSICKEIFRLNEYDIILGTKND